MDTTSCQWLAENLKNEEVYGYSSNGRSKFLIYLDQNSENNLIGLTNTGKKFWVSMYDDLDKMQFLRLNDSLPVDTKLTTESFENLVKSIL